MPEDTQRPVGATGRLCALQSQQRQAIKGPGMALYNVVNIWF